MGFEAVDPQVLEAQRLTAANQAEEARLGLQAQQIANAAAADAARAQQAQNTLEATERNAEAQRAATLRGQEMTQRGFDKQRAFEQKNIDQQRSDDLKWKRYETQRDALLRKYGMQSVNNNANRSNTFNYQAHSLASSYPSGVAGTRDQKQQWLEEIAQLRKDYLQDVSDNAFDTTLKQRALERDMGTLDTSIQDMWAILQQRVQKGLQVGQTALNVTAGFGNSIMDNTEAWHNILLNMDMEGVTTSKGKGIGAWFQRKFQDIEDFDPWLTAMIGAPAGGGGIQVPSGTSAESLAGYDEFWKIFKGYDTRGARKGEGGLIAKGEQLVSLVNGWRSAEEEQVRSGLLDMGFSTTQIDDAGLGGGAAFQESMANLQGVSQEDWNEARLVGAMERLGMSPEQIEAEGHSMSTRNWVDGVVEGTTWNPLFHPDTIRDITGNIGGDYIRPVAFNTFGQEEIMSGKAVSGETSFLRYAGQLAQYWNATSPGMGDNVLSAVNSFLKFQAANETPAAMKIMREEMGEIASRDGGIAFQVLDAMADSWGNEIRFSAAGDPTMTSRTIIQNAKDGGFGLDDESEEAIEEFNKSATQLQDMMGKFAGAWNTAIGGGYGGADILQDSFLDSAINTFIAKNPGMTPGNIPDDIVDKIMGAAKKAVGGTMAGAPEGVAEAFAARMLEGLDTSLLEQSGQSAVDITAELEKLVRSAEQTELDYAFDQGDMSLLHTQDSATSEAEMEGELGLLADEFFGGPATSPSP